MGNIFELTEVEEQIFERLQKRIVFSENKNKFGDEETYKLILTDIILGARFIGLSRVFPFYDYSTKELPTKYADWQYRCCIELYNLADKSGFNTYSENGLSWGKKTDGISLQLLEEITSKAGIPGKIKEDGTDE